MQITLRGGVFDGHNLPDLPDATMAAERILIPLSLYAALTDERPNLAVCRSNIGLGSNWTAAFICLYEKTAEGPRGRQVHLSRRQHGAPLPGPGR